VPLAAVEEQKNTIKIEKPTTNHLNSEELVIGRQTISDLVETCEKNNHKYLNIKKFETQCKQHPSEEKNRLVLKWCEKMLSVWEQ
jgi:hypothetical protein